MKNTNELFEERLKQRNHFRRLYWNSDINEDDDPPDTSIDNINTYNDASEHALQNMNMRSITYNPIHNDVAPSPILKCKQEQFDARMKMKNVLNQLKFKYERELVEEMEFWYHNGGRRRKIKTGDGTYKFASLFLFPECDRELKKKTKRKSDPVASNAFSMGGFAFVSNMVYDRVGTKYIEKKVEVIKEKIVEVPLKIIEKKVEVIKEKEVEVKVPITEKEAYECKICLENPIGIVFECGHMCCSGCADKLTRCYLCRTVIKKKQKMYF